jgi:hypothetical protein
MKLTYISLLFLILVQHVASALAQVQINMARQFGRNDASVQEDLQGSMRMEIDAMRRVVNLSEAAAKKLEVASIAAIKSAIKKGPPGQLPGPLFGTDNAEQSNPTAKPAPGQGGIPFVAAIDEEAVKREEIWKKTIANTLSPEQIQNFETFLETRRQNARALAIQNRVNELDSYLFLSDEQRTAMNMTVERVLGDTLDKRQKLAGGLGGRGNQVVVMMAGQVDKDLTVDDVRAILSPSQLAEFERQTKRHDAGPFGALPPQIGRQVGGMLGIESSSPIGFDIEENTKGLVVARVADDSDASRAGVRAGDIIDSVGKTPVDTVVQLKRAMKTIAATEEVNLTILRDGQKMVLTIRLTGQE